MWQYRSFSAYPCSSGEAALIVSGRVIVRDERLMPERAMRKTRVGRVVSNKMQNTVVVSVENTSLRVWGRVYWSFSSASASIRLSSTASTNAELSQ